MQVAGPTSNSEVDRGGTPLPLPATAVAKHTQLVQHRLRQVGDCSVVTTTDIHVLGFTDVLPTRPVLDLRTKRLPG